MAIEGLGRAFNVVPIAGGVALKMKDCSGITFVCTSSAINAVFTLTVSPTFGGSYTQPTGFNPINHYYQSTATAGTAAWTRVAQSASNAVTQAASGATTVIELLGPMIPDTYAYVKCTNSGGAGLVTAILHDLAVQRKPANLAIVSA